MMNDGEKLREMGTDGLKWAHGFLEVTNLENAGPDFRGTVVAWFANAIEAGRIAGRAEGVKLAQASQQVPVHHEDFD